jgi:hypothetical protein
MMQQRIGHLCWRVCGLLAVWALIFESVEASIDAPGFGYEASTDVSQ